MTRLGCVLYERAVKPSEGQECHRNEHVPVAAPGAYTYYTTLRYAGVCAEAELMEGDLGEENIRMCVCVREWL